MQAINRAGLALLARQNNAIESGLSLSATTPSCRRAESSLPVHFRAHSDTELAGSLYIAVSRSDSFKGAILFVDKFPGTFPGKVLHSGDHFKIEPSPQRNGDRTTAPRT